MTDLQQPLPEKKENLITKTLNAVKGSDTNKLVEQFTAEMTLVAEGLCDDQMRLRHDTEALRLHAEQRMTSIENQADSQEHALLTLQQELNDRLNQLTRRMDALENTARKNPPKQDKTGLISKLTLLAGIVCGSWVLVTILQLFRSYTGGMDMKSYQEMVAEYRRRQRDTVVDSNSVGLTYVDELAVESGLLEETGLLTELTGAACSALPFVVIAATEGSKVILGRKPGKTGLKDSAYRMAKTGAAIGLGTLATAAAGFWAAIPVTMGVRAIFDGYRSKALIGMRVQSRIKRLTELRGLLNRQDAQTVETAEPTDAIEAPAPC